MTDIVIPPIRLPAECPPGVRRAFQQVIEQIERLAAQVNSVSGDVDDLTTFDDYTPNENDFIVSGTTSWDQKTLAQTKTILGLDSLGTMSIQNKNAVDITGGDIYGITRLDVGASYTNRANSYAATFGSNNSIGASGGYGIAAGLGSSIEDEEQISFGEHAKGPSTLKSALTQACGRFVATGDAQTIKFNLKASTTDATSTVLGDSTHRFSIVDENAYAVFCIVAGRQDTGAAHYLAIREFIIERTGGTVALSGSVQTVGTDINGGSWGGVTITADDTNKRCSISVVGAAATNIRWLAHVVAVKIGYAN